MLKSSDTVKLIVSAFIITSILITFPAPTQAKDTKSCISKTMPWEDASACVSKTKKSSTPVVLGASTASTANKPASLNSDVIFDMINAHRASIGLPAYQKDERICQVARERGPELYNEIFVTGKAIARNVRVRVSVLIVRQQRFLYFQKKTNHKPSVQIMH